jgi:formylglycine-generating enzyme required for sulfatase activity
MLNWKWIRVAVALSASVAASQGEAKFVHLPATTFQVSDTATGIPVTVHLSAFAVSPHEVTQQEYLQIVGNDPSLRKGANLPVQNVSWWDAIRYCNLRSIAEKLEPCYDLNTGACDRKKNGYRLLTEAEWTRAAGKLADAKDVARIANLGPENTKDTALLVAYARANGPKPVGSLAANEHGLYDMLGNVWEWVQDYQDPSGAVSAAADPSGPDTGVARVLRGGSYLTTTSRWGRAFKSSLEPERRSPYTGFRICRSLPEATLSNTGDNWFDPYDQVPAAFAGATGDLSQLTAVGAAPDSWPQRRASLQLKWAQILGKMSGDQPAPAVRHISTHHEPTYTGELMYLQVEPDYWEKIYIMLPTTGVDRSHPLPVVIVPYYDVDTPAGMSMGGRSTTPLGTRAYGHLAVQRGMAAIAIRWFGESYGENTSEVVANLKLRHPAATGLGKWVWDSNRLLDYIATRPEFDTKRVAMIGHSLGGKMTLYAAAMDERIRAAVSSEPGIGLSFSNYDDFWYLGEDMRKLEKGTDHHELLALMAPRPFLLIGGDSADSDKSWHYINSARQVYSLFGVPKHIGYINHRKGHSPTPESIHLAMEWLARFLR